MRPEIKEAFDRVMETLTVDQKIIVRKFVDASVTEESNKWQEWMGQMNAARLNAEFKNDALRSEAGYRDSVRGSGKYEGRS